MYDLYQLCRETKDLREFCADYGVHYDKFMKWQRHQLWSEKLGKTVHVESPKAAKVRITGKPCNSPTVKMELKQPEGEPPKMGEVATVIRRYTIPEKHHRS